MSDQSEEQKGKAVKEESPEIDSSVEEGSLEQETAEAATQSEKELLEKAEKDYLYLRAEFENFKRQSVKERSQLLKFGAERLARDLLDTLDVFKSALASEVTEENFGEFVKGVEMTAQSMKAALEKHGIVEVDCVGQPFDPNTQEALSSEVSEDLPEGHVTQVFKSPYKYHDKLLRPGQVIVSRPKSE